MNRKRERLIWRTTILLTTLMGILIVLGSYWLVFAYPLLRPLPGSVIAFAADYSVDNQTFFYRPLQQGVIDEALEDAEQIERQRQANQNRDNPNPDNEDAATPLPSPTAIQQFASPTPTATNPSVGSTNQPDQSPTPTRRSTQTATLESTVIWFPTSAPTNIPTNTARPTQPDQPAPTSTNQLPTHTSPPTNTAPPPTNTPRPTTPPDPYPPPTDSPPSPTRTPRPPSYP